MPLIVPTDQGAFECPAEWGFVLYAIVGAAAPEFGQAEWASEAVGWV